jgi:hypothetical protein
MTDAAGRWDQWLLENSFGTLVAGHDLFLLCHDSIDKSSSNNNCNCWDTITFKITCFEKSIPIDYFMLASFCAWEVLMMAIVMIAILMPSIINTILKYP